MKNKLLAYILRPYRKYAISIVKSYDVIDNKIKYAGIHILLMICAFYIIVLSNNNKRRQPIKARHRITPQCKQIGSRRSHRHNLIFDIFKIHNR